MRLQPGRMCIAIISQCIFPIVYMQLAKEIYYFHPIIYCILPIPNGMFPIAHFMLSIAFGRK